MATQRDFAVPLRAQEGSAEMYLRDVCGIPENLVDAVLITAVAWRVTPGGRPLIDRRRRCRCERNMPLVSKYLQEHCSISPGVPGLRLFSLLSLVVPGPAIHQVYRVPGCAVFLIFGVLSQRLHSQVHTPSSCQGSHGSDSTTC